jgi:hypothetical protein
MRALERRLKMANLLGCKGDEGKVGSTVHQATSCSRGLFVLPAFRERTFARREGAKGENMKIEDSKANDEPTGTEAELPWTAPPRVGCFYLLTVKSEFHYRISACTKEKDMTTENSKAIDSPNGY